MPELGFAPHQQCMYWAILGSALRGRPAGPEAVLGGLQKLRQQWRAAVDQLREADWDRLRKPEVVNQAKRCRFPGQNPGRGSQSQRFTCRLHHICPWCWARMFSARTLLRILRKP